MSDEDLFYMPGSIYNREEPRASKPAPPGAAPTGADLDAARLALIAERLEDAFDMVARLCLPRDDPQSREWLMSIPARPRHDPDLVIGAALNDAQALLTEVMTLRVQQAAAAAVTGAAGRLGRAWERLCRCTDEFVPDYPFACSDHEQALYGAVEAVLAAARPTPGA